MTKKLEVKPKSPSAKPSTDSRKDVADELQARFSHTLQSYEQALKLLQTQKFEKAKLLLEKVIESGISELADRAKVHINICNQQLDQIQNTFQTPEEHYDFAVSLMNLGDFVTAREHLEGLSTQRPALDFVWYGFAVLECLTGRTSESLKHLAEAIRLNPGNRFQARNDSDFRNMADDPRFTELLYPEGTVGAYVPAPARAMTTANPISNRLEGLRVVAIGGGTGLSTLLRGLKRHVISISPADSSAPAPLAPFISRLTGIVTVTDDGGSSGRLRKELGVPPPGDIRNCLTALSDDEELLSQLFRYRFTGSGGGLEGHSFGNLFLTALADVCGDFSLAVKLSSAILKTRGEIYPSSTGSNVQLDALMRDGQRVRGETNITASRSGIARLRLVPANVQPLPQALDAILHADIISIGPGSLFTSCIPNLLVCGVPEAIARSNAVRVYIGNLMTQPNESTGLTASQHIQAIFDHARCRVFEYAMLNCAPAPSELRARYAEDNSEPLHNDLDQIRALGVTPILGDYLDATQFARHATDRIALDLLNLPARLQSERQSL